MTDTESFERQLEKIFSFFPLAVAHVQGTDEKYDVYTIRASDMPAILAAHRREVVEARIAAYRDCKSKGGTANAIRSYALSRIDLLKDQLEMQSNE